MAGPIPRQNELPRQMDITQENTTEAGTSSNLQNLDGEELCQGQEPQEVSRIMTGSGYSDGIIGQLVAQSQKAAVSVSVSLCFMKIHFLLWSPFVP